MERSTDRLQLARDEFMGDLRREERRDLLLRKQAYSLMVPEGDSDVIPFLTIYGELAPVLTEVVKNALNEKAENSNIAVYAQALIYGTLADQHKAIILIRKISCSEVDQSCELILQNELLPYLIDLAKNDEQPYLQIEANWILSNFCSRSEHIVRKAVEKGVIPIFLQNVSKPNLKLAEQTVWGIGNLSVDSYEYREIMISNNAMGLLVNLYQKVKVDNKALARFTVWAASCLCRSKPFPPLERIGCGFGMFVEALIQADRDETKINCIWSLRTIISKMDNCAEVFTSSGIIPTLVNLLHSSHTQIIQPLLLIFGTITGNSKKYNKNLIGLGIIAGLDSILSAHVKSLKKQALLVLANIACGDSDDVEQILSCSSMLMTVFQLSTCNVTEIAENALWVLGNMCGSSDFRQIERLLELKLLGVASHILHSYEPSESQLCMLIQTLQKLLKKAQEESTKHFDLLMDEIEKEGILEPLEKLQDSNSTNVYKASHDLITEFFETQTHF